MRIPPIVPLAAARPSLRAPRPPLAAVCVALTAAVCLAGLTAACSAQGPTDGTLTGHLYGVGGPSPGLPRAWPGTVTLTGPDLHLDVQVGTGGTFSVTVPPGQYTLVGHSPNYESGAAPCHAAGAATVTSGHTTNADVWCQMSLFFSTERSVVRASRPVTRQPLGRRP